LRALSVNAEYIRRLVNDIKESIRVVRSYVSKPFNELSEAERYAIRYHLIVIAEALIALALHVARRLFEAKPETPIHALRILREHGMITDDEMRDIANIIKLRNILVHRYWLVDDERIYENAVKDFARVLSFVERVLNRVFRERV